VAYIRQSSVESRDTNFQTPKNGGVKRPSYHLDFGAHDPVVVFIRVDVEFCALLRCHVAVCETTEFGTNKVRCHDLCGENQLLDVSVSMCERPGDRYAHEANRSSSWITYTSQWHQIVIDLPVGWPHAAPSEVDPNDDGDQANGEEGERLCGRHAVNCKTCTTANVAVKESFDGAERRFTACKEGSRSP
jgi:hypothetical protein